MKRNIGKNYSPLFFLSALGNGGLTVAFFIFFMFMTPHPDTPIATFDSVWTSLAATSLPVKALAAVCYALMLYFAFNHLRMLVWNIREYRLFKKTDDYNELIQGSNEISLMTIPLTLTMTINVMFVLGAMLVPGLWNIVEYLFPFAFLAFLATGIYSLTLFYNYYRRLLTGGNFQHSKNNSLSQMLSSFTFAMNAVGFAAPAAMSENPVMISIAAFCSIFFFAIATLLAIKNLLLGFHAMMDKGISREASASLWILIPILTLLGITAIRLHHGFHTLFHGSGSPSFYFIWCSSIVSIQIFAGILGFVIMRQNDYFSEFIHGVNLDPEIAAARTPASYALICPGVAFWVFGMFFLDKALIHSGLLNIFSVPYFILLAPLLFVLVKTIRVNWKLNKRLLQEGTE
ncbi:hypothetical protein UWK_02173 [Desulfocapsa sulfexigens DSM 10523]|uniref:Uncharacterized protein n=1 Tax=Desulfocapsa sulfexigens (strain DSM 10523 / SB164P1) TaxID=1167006 RepID=M1NGD3_DESSD|nr:hypothetical protein [Desulfocapsa sulfexigens]AGF78714.1 hypothetical protein UWK_02173 [Desulfocapsa sulfexigens DSM 10523]